MSDFGHQLFVNPWFTCIIKALKGTKKKALNKFNFKWNHNERVDITLPSVLMVAYVMWHVHTLIVNELIASYDGKLVLSNEKFNIVELT